MALTTTTLAAACAKNDKTISVTSATGFAAGNLVKIDIEVMQVTKDYVSGTSVGVLRGLDGSEQIAHVSGVNVNTYLGTDAANDAPGGPSTSFPTQPAQDLRSYAAAGAIALPFAGRNMVAQIIGTGALAMTLANPTKDLDGSLLIIVGNGKAAHTVTYTAGLGNGGSALDVLTFAAGGQQSLWLIASNAIWVPQSVLAGTLTNITVTAS